jgi:serine/threonine protein kinase
LPSFFPPSCIFEKFGGKRIVLCHKIQVPESGRGFLKLPYSHKRSTIITTTYRKETMETPKEWPKEIAESYDPMRVLGSGGFASVVLARKKNSDKISAEDIPARAISVATPKRVAVKVVGCNDGTGNYVAAVLYARREIELLQQIRHCGIVKLFHSWERENNNEKENSEDRSRGFSPTAGVLVLEYLKGPTVESLLKHGGALSNTFGRVIIAQVMDAIAYLHYRAVLHRDIKPDNIIGTYITSRLLEKEVISSAQNIT